MALGIDGYFARREQAEIERHEMLQQSPTTELVNARVAVANSQPVRLQIALVLLLVALAVVIVKDRDFWFGSDDEFASDATSSQSTPKATSAAAAAKATQPSAAPATTAKNHVAAKTFSKPAVTQTSQPDSDGPSAAVATTRTILPPLDVEVVAGDNHSMVHPGSNVAKVEIRDDSNRQMASVISNAASRERLTGGSVPELRQTVDAGYPLLGQHSQVQGSVVLQAVVGADGNIETLSVLSGPSILSAAAQQAVRQWRFKPYLQNGQPVETKARITVNFSIRISDNPATS
jgi:TonB family protein